MNRRLIFAFAAAAVLVTAGAGGVYVYFFSGVRSSPTALALSSTSSPAFSPSPLSSDPAGTWKVASGSVAGYRVREMFAGQSSLHEAVARTSVITGVLSASSDGAAVGVTGIDFTADLRALHSVDQVAGHDVSQRDSVVSRSLEMNRFPTATFKASAVTLPADFTTGATDSLSVQGQLTVHGVTRDVIAAVQIRLNGAQVQLDGSIQVQMSDFNITPPQAPFVTVQTAVTVEFQLFLTKS
jgi:polyisoprenoid-binding protein YceI